MQINRLLLYYLISRQRIKNTSVKFRHGAPAYYSIPAGRAGTAHAGTALEQYVASVQETNLGK